MDPFGTSDLRGANGADTPTGLVLPLGHDLSTTVATTVAMWRGSRKTREESLVSETSGESGCDGTMIEHENTGAQRIVSEVVCTTPLREKVREPYPDRNVMSDRVRYSFDDDRTLIQAIETGSLDQSTVEGKSKANPSNYIKQAKRFARSFTR